jgi:homospermidine synthase
MQSASVYGRIDGPIVMIGFGSIGRGTLPLIERHFEFDLAELVVIEPSASHRTFLAQRGIRHLQVSLTRENYREVLGSVLGSGRGFCINLSVDTSSRDIMRFCRELGVPYIDTVTEPWPGFYFDEDRPNAKRTNYGLRESIRAEKSAGGVGSTAVSCCGANPGMVSWLVKEALLVLARDLGRRVAVPSHRAEWARLMHDLGVKGVHIAERDTQVSHRVRQLGTFVNTWSVEGFLAEGFQPAEVGWGTHERTLPAGANHHESGCRAAIWLDRPGADTRVRSWCPTPGPQFGYLVTHNEAISIADYYTLGDPAAPVYRPTCHYAYHPCADAVMSLHETLGAGKMPARQHILDEHEITEGVDELGVLLYGHAKNALWYGSRLSINEARDLAPFQNATGLQVTSAVLAGMVWALENPGAGVVEADEMDHARCLAVQRPYLGPIEAHYTDWTPLTHRLGPFGEVPAPSDPWQFVNVLAP